MEKTSKIKYCIKMLSSLGYKIYNPEDFTEQQFTNYLDELRDAYYTEKPRVTDDEYDRLLNVFYNRFGKEYVRVGIAHLENERKTIKLPRYMQSLDKIKNDDTKKFENWVRKHHGPYVISDKLDGISCGMWGEKTFTQGDGETGYDISHLNKYLGNKNVDGLPRGEIVILKSVFNKKYAKEYSNPRNLVTGIVGKKTITPKVKDLTFIAYNWSPINEKPLTPYDQFLHLQKLGFKTPFFTLTDKISIDYLEKLYLERKSEADYDMDGLVVYQNIWEDIVKGELVPKNAFAFKVEGSSVITHVKFIEWRVSKLGKLKPTAVFDEVDLGVKINKATAFSAKFVLENKLGPGAEIEIVRSGDVIPYIKRVLKGTESQMPDVEWRWVSRNDEVSNVDIEVVEENNKDMEIEKINNFFSKLKAKNVGKESIVKLYEDGYTTIRDFLSLKVEDVLKVEGFAKRSAERLIDSIQNSVKNVGLAKLVGATGIFGEGIGERKFQSILDKHPDFLEVSRDMDTDEIEELLKNVGGFQKKASVIASGMDVLRRFLEDHPQISLEKVEIQELDRDNKLGGKNIVFTGFRDENLENEIKKLGGKVTTSVSKNTDFLIKRGNDTTTKEVKAMQLGIKIYSIDQFRKEFL